MLSMQLINGVLIDWDKIDRGSYLREIPAIHDVDRIDFSNPVTFFVGENGSGKSTLLEAIAVEYGFNPEGGTRNYNFSTYDSHSELCQAIRLSRGVRRARYGYFLRAESFYNAATYLDSMDARALRSYGGRSLHKMSHGESFLALVENRFSPDGLFILDEPEAAVSPTRMLRLMADIHELAKGGAQFIISTHSPLLITLPGADILQFTEKGMARVPYEETEHFRVTRDFLADPQRMLRILLED